jgi:hypothetical protein
MSDFQFDIEALPLPPPWAYEMDVEDRTYFVNTKTGEKTHEHPFVRAVGLSKDDDEMLGVKKALAGLKDTLSRTAAAKTPQLKQNGERGDSLDKSGTVDLQALNMIDKTLTPTKKEGVPSTNYRCVWKESSLFGECNSYGLRIRYFDDQRTMVKIDGVDGEWILTQLDGQYGPVNKYDLFVGGKVRIFGRWLTITSASASVCHGITVEAKRMEKMIAAMQGRIEGVGAVPIIRRSVPTTVRHIVRSAQPEGHENLRKILIDCTKLSEQMCSLGLAHVVKDFGTTYGSNHIE